MLTAALSLVFSLLQSGMQSLVNELLLGPGYSLDAVLAKTEAEVPEADLTKEEADFSGKNRSEADRRQVC